MFKIEYDYTNHNLLTDSVLSFLCRKLLEYIRTLWVALSQSLRSSLKYFLFTKINSSKFLDRLWPFPRPIFLPLKEHKTHIFYRYISHNHGRALYYKYQLVLFSSVTRTCLFDIKLYMSIMKSQSIRFWKTISAGQTWCSLLQTMCAVCNSVRLLWLDR